MNFKIKIGDSQQQQWVQ